MSRPSRFSALARLSPSARACLLGLGLVASLALFAPALPLADPNAVHLDRRLIPPLSDAGLLGTDHLGRDLLSRTLWGMRLSLGGAAIATALALLIGGSIGLVAAYWGRERPLIDAGTMRAIDVLLAFPYLLLALAIVAALGPGIVNALIAVAVVNIPFFARTLRGAAWGLAEREFVTLARLANESHAAILARQILPNVVPAILVAVSTTFGWMILETAGLSFLGLGAQPPQADLGAMLGQGRALFLIAPHIVLVPGLTIVAIVLMLTVLADGLRDAFDPRLAGLAATRPAAATHAETSTRKANDDALLSVRSLNVCLTTPGGEQPLVRDLSFDLDAGECLGLVGESGSGKSLSMLAMARLLPSPPMRLTGSIRFQGEEVTALSPAALRAIRGRGIAYIFQDPGQSLDPLMPIGQQIAEALPAGASSHKQVADLLVSVGLEDTHRISRALPSELSGGMRQRAAIAVALAGDPDLIIADEPTTALDTLTQAQILELLDQLRRSRGLAMIFISHDLGVVRAIADRIAVAYSGELVELGPTTRVLEAPAHPYTKALLAATPRLGLELDRLGAIAGDPPAPTETLPGCRFAARCPLAIDACRQGGIPLRPVNQGAARCIRTEAV